MSTWVFDFCLFALLVKNTQQNVPSLWLLCCWRTLVLYKFRHFNMCFSHLHNIWQSLLLCNPAFSGHQMYVGDNCVYLFLAISEFYVFLLSTLSCCYRQLKRIQGVYHCLVPVLKTVHFWFSLFWTCNLTFFSSGFLTV